MKIRQGFVSNSSSCSFVVAGVMIDKDKLDFNDCLRECLMDDDEIYFSDHPETGAKEGKVLIGYLIAEGDDCEFDSTELTLDEIKDKCKKITKKLNIEQETKIFTGIRMC